MKTIKMKSNRATNKIYKKKCKAFAKIIKMWVQVNTSRCQQIAVVQAEINKLCDERKALLKKLAKCNINVGSTQLYYKGKSEAKFNTYPKEKPKKKTKSKS